ncbi:MAG: hypothetical protein ABS53_00670 [Hydrogenophaga sp. SCN 70-13]|jgi:hypothetical protein|uniref:hypothetical protein n=1 Tax=Hydrogenophaga TaxID=47420 RepID=UPI0008687789|nr:MULTISPECIES: hypothetical protein [unclassified Hydrogenophaga]MBN9372989.1 hypothetical protein [Hydrogenophaga sp.]ODT34572.1 MAG: hypothetical protein ABS53_00670 [Hydrogenophaga sp. SCN 70-13]OJV57393.1 MAG: hypothetical protein BGO22_12090 [Hydrogenophaga sp. 70-12]
MARCDVCGNDYDRSFQIVTQDRTVTVDSFECGIHACAPACAHCGCKVIGHGVQDGERIFCCAHCARESGVDALQDRS